MRMMVTMKIPAAAGNKALQDGRLQKVIQETMARLKPEAAYFGPGGGKRSALFVFDMEKVTDMPAVLEPFFAELEADVEIMPVMDAKDLVAGLGQIGPR
jgi:hypothetical protein